MGTRLGHLGEGTRSAPELRAAAIEVSNRLTAILHLARALEGHAAELSMDAETLDFVRTRATSTRDALLASTSRSEAEAPGGLAKLAWTIDGPLQPGETEASRLSAFEGAVATAASAATTLEGTLDALRSVLLDDAHALRETLATRLASLGRAREPPFLVDALDRLERLEADATADDPLEALRRAARGVLDARAALDEARRLEEALAAAETLVADLWRAVEGPHAADLRALHEPVLLDRLAVALDAPDAARVDETLARFTARVRGLRAGAREMERMLRALDEHRARAHRLPSPALRDAMLRLADALTGEIPRRVERGEKLPSVVVSHEALEAVVRVHAMPRVATLVARWPACDAWLVLAHESSVPRKVASALADIVDAREASRHKEMLDPAFQAWAVLAARQMPPATGPALAARLDHVRRHESRLLQLELPRALGAMRLDDADLAGDAMHERTRALARMPRAHAALVETLQGKLSADLASGEVALEVLQAVARALLGPEAARSDAGAGSDAALEAIVAREAGRRWVATVAALSLELGVEPAKVRQAAQAAARRAGARLIYHEGDEVLVAPPRGLRELDTWWKFRERVAGAIRQQDDAEQILREARALAAAGGRA